MANLNNHLTMKYMRDQMSYLHHHLKTFKYDVKERLDTIHKLHKSHMSKNPESPCYVPYPTYARVLSKPVQDAIHKSIDSPNADLSHQNLEMVAVAYLDYHQSVMSCCPWVEWRLAKPIYRFHPRALAHIIDSKISSISWDAIKYLPYHGIYVEYEQVVDGVTYDGFFACTVSNAPTDPYYETAFLLVRDDHTDGLGKTIFIPLIHEGSSILGSLESTAARQEIYNAEMDANLSTISESTLKQRRMSTANHQGNLFEESMKNMVKILMYLCSEGAELEFSRPINTNEQVASAATVIEVAGKAGKTIEASEIAGCSWTSSDNYKPHIRSAHFHGYWVGPRGNQTLIVKWIPPIFVNEHLVGEVESDPRLILVE